MDNLSESKSIVKIINLDSEATEDGIKQLIMLLVQLKGTIQDTAIVNVVNGEHSHNYAYMSFQYDCDAKETAAALSGLYYKSCILNATVLNENACNEASLLLSKIQNTNKADHQLNSDECRKSSSCSSTASKEFSHEKGCISDEPQSKSSTSSSTGISNEKLSSDDSDELQNVAGKTSSSVCDEEENDESHDESQSGSDNDSDTESEDDDDDDDSKSSTESKTIQKSEQIARRDYSARHDKNHGNRGRGWRGRGRGRGRGGRYNNNHNSDRRHNVPNSTHQAHRGSNWGHQKYHPSNNQASQNFNAAAHFLKGSDLKWSNIQNQNYQTSETQRPQIWNIPPNLPFVPNCGPFNNNHQSQYPGNSQGFPNYNMPPPNFSPPVNQYNQQQNYDKSTTISSNPNTQHNPQNVNNEAAKNINLSISWTQQRGNQNNDDNRKNQVTGNLCNTSAYDQPLSKSRNNLTHNQASFRPNFHRLPSNQNTYSDYKQQIDNVNNQGRKNQSDNFTSPNAGPSQNQFKKSDKETVTRPMANPGTAITNPNISTSSPSTVGRVPPPVPSRIKQQPTTHTGVSRSSSTSSITPAPRALPNIDAVQAATRLNVGATKLSTKPCISDKKKTDKPCVIS